MSESAVVRSEETQKSQVDAETLSQVIAEKHIGDRIRRLRLKKSMVWWSWASAQGFRPVSCRSWRRGVGADAAEPGAVAMVFSKDLSYFFESDPSAVFSDTQAQERVRLPQTGVEFPTYFFESLGYMVPDRQMDPTLPSCAADQGDGAQGAHAPGFEFLYVLEGELELPPRGTGIPAGSGRRGVFRLEHSTRIPVPGQKAGRGHYCDAAPVGGRDAAAGGECEGIGEKCDGRGGKGEWGGCGWDVACGYVEDPADIG